MRESEAARRGLTPLARLAGHPVAACGPAHFSQAPVPAIGRILTRAEWDLTSVGLFEINEAFAAVTLLAMKAHWLKRGVASLCIGGREATAIVIEAV
jgi:acetyl-CoA C-acetyltransferase